MIIKDKYVTLEIDDEILNQEKSTKLFLDSMVRIIKKGAVSPAYQLHILSMILTGRTFKELMDGEEQGKTVEDIVKLMMVFSGNQLYDKQKEFDLKDILDGTLEESKPTENGSGLSDTDIDSFLGKENEDDEE